MDPLSPNACRVLGSLLEKELTVPDTYPLTSNALRSACNQTTGREPVLALSDSEVTDAVDELRQAGLVRLVHPSHGARQIKYRQVADEHLALDAPQRAVLTVLLLRGAQTPGELRSRSERLHPFASVDEVEHALDRLSGRDDALVAMRARRPGQKEQRWAHLLAGDPGDDPSTVERVVERATEPVAVPPEVAALAAFVGTWVGGGEGEYPTIQPFAYTEQIELRPVPGKPMLAYRSATRAVDDGRALHGESGFLRVVGGDRAELVVAQGAGIVEAAEGLVDGGELLLASTLIAGTTTAKQVTATDRRYHVDGDTLTYELAMAAVGQPLLSHLRGKLARQPVGTG
jgi:uncharacterized protein YceH (UPF0502 family)